MATAGAEGDAYTFITPEQDRFAGDIVKALTMSSLTVPSDLQALADGAWGTAACGHRSQMALT